MGVKTKTSFGSDKQPKTRRGRSQKTLILEVLREKSQLGLSPDSSKEDSEKAFIYETAKKAFNPEDKDAGMCFKLLWDKGWASIKPSSETVEFDLDPEASPAIKVNQIINAASKGEIPPDIAKIFIESIKSVIEVEQATDLQERIEAIEKALVNNESSSANKED